MHEKCLCEHDDQVIIPATNEPKQAEQAESNRESKLESDLAACRQELQSWKERFVRVSADFENFKRRTEKEQASWVRSSKAAVLRNLLPIVDDIDRALAELHKKERTAETESWFTGFEMIGAAFHKFLKESGVTEIAEMHTFDPLLHEALVHIDAPEHASGSIVEVMQKGYMLGDQVLRPAKVSVAK